MSKAKIGHTYNGVKGIPYDRDFLISTDTSRQAKDKLLAELEIVENNLENARHYHKKTGCGYSRVLKQADHKRYIWEMLYYTSWDRTA